MGNGAPEIIDPIVEAPAKRTAKGSQLSLRSWLWQEDHQKLASGGSWGLFVWK